jgi:6,7-dimethyl-8-ribityllumazine synthase
MNSDLTIKGIEPTNVKYNGSQLRVAIVHARWNKTVIEALLEGALKKLKEFGVKQNNIVVQSVPGSFELPMACSRFVSNL